MAVKNGNKHTRRKIAKKTKAIQPDDYFSAGPFQLARFGKNIISQTKWPEGKFDEMQEKLVERFPEVVQSIDNVISKIANLVKTLPPEKVLQRAWGEMAVHHLGISSESDIERDDAISQRMVDYLQSVITSIKPDDEQEDEITEDVWQALRNLVGELFSQLNLNYQICRTAATRNGNPDYDEEFEELYFSAQLFWCNVRGKRYLYHEEVHFFDLISPHSDALDELFGITAEQLIGEIVNIQHALTRGMGEEIGRASCRERV